VFKVSKDQVCVVISAAEKIAEMTKEDVASLAEKELKMCVTELKDHAVIKARVIKEMRATFVPDKESLTNRPSAKTSLTNLFLAGDWTDTGLPATIEGAVKSARSCVNEIEKQ